VLLSAQEGLCSWDKLISVFKITSFLETSFRCCCEAGIEAA
jgi:hypothetical protein